MHKEAQTMIKAECTWGDGPDVLLVAKDQEHNALFDLTRLQAFTLAQSLLGLQKSFCLGRIPIVRDMLVTLKQILHQMRLR